MKTLGIPVIAVLLTTALAAAEGPKPNFSGTWRLNRAKSKLETIVPEQAELVFVIEHDDPRFKMTRTLTQSERSDTLSWETTTDGKEHHRRDGDFEFWM